jgi:hypothetical protein
MKPQDVEPTDDRVESLPFGEVSCERELSLLKDRYTKYYFDHAPFNDASLDADRYLIVGRRGSGKTSLAQYFTFQRRIRHSRCISVSEPEVYARVLSELNRLATSGALPVVLNRAARVWELLIWSLIFEEFRNEDEVVADACIFQTASGRSPARIVADVIRAIMTKILGKSDTDIVQEIENTLRSKVFEAGKDRVVQLTRKVPILLAIDSLEHYPVDDDMMMKVTAALIQAASEFNLKYRNMGIHIKVFLASEITPFLIQNVLANPLKHVQNPVHLHWRPKDLLRLICWRFTQYLVEHRHLSKSPLREDQWSDFDAVHKAVWSPYFGDEVTNSHEIVERSFPYVLRHTQMRPRQLVFLCNQIAATAKRSGEFPKFSSAVIRQGVWEAETELATEVINSYKEIYPKVADIIEAFVGAPVIFPGQLLDKLAHFTAGSWKPGEYSPQRFRQLVTELGIVGRVRSKNSKRGIVEVDFEYFERDRLTINNNDECAIHPMFYGKLRTKVSADVQVLPFPDHPDPNEFRV